MPKFSMLTPEPAVTRLTTKRRGLLYGAAITPILASTLFLAGCAAEWQNTLPAREVARLTAPPGSVYMGWRVFQDRCASCHGSAATGTLNAPDLLPRVRDMGSRQFVSLVLDRYNLNLGTPASSTNVAREAQVEVIMQRKEAPLSMPAWGSEPRVNAHIADLYAYLAARAEGTQGPERPAP